MTTVMPGFAVRSDVSHFERAGEERLNVTLELRYVQDYDAERDAKTLRDRAETIERVGGWSVEYDAERPRNGIIALRHIG
jgi:hypothetical protein